MRRALVIVPVLGLALAGPVRAEVTKTLRVQLSGDAGRPFAVENLAGTMRVTPGSEDAVVAVATVHGDSDALASSIRFEQVTNEKGVPTLRVRYPVDRHDSFRYPPAGSGGFWDSFFGGSRIKYDGVRVSVSGSRGVGLWADVEVRVPKRVVTGTFTNHVGTITAEGLEGKIRLDASSGDITAQAMRGEIVTDTGSGNITASNVEGAFVCDTGSGNCSVKDFKGDTLKCDTGSGAVDVDQARARAIVADTGSGRVRVHGADAEEFAADTGSGSVEFEGRGSRLTKIKADTGSGSVRLSLPAEAGFELRADTGSGDIVSRFRDAEAIVHRKEVVGYRRGDARIRIDVDTGSGDVVVEPVK